MSEGPLAGTSNSPPVEEGDDMAIYKKKACKVVSFQIIKEEDDLESEKAITFKPDMAHQIFGENIESSGKINKPGMKPDDILKALDPWLPSNYTRSYDEFVEWIKEEQHDKMYGQVVNSFGTISQLNGASTSVTYQITENDVSDEDFKEFHARFETYIIWFIDAANYIDLDDHRWLIFYVYEECKHPEKKTIYQTPVAFCSVYKFYAYPNKIRPRISQIFVLPSHQRRGIGTNLYEAVSQRLRATEDVVDIAVEEPTSSFQKIRDLQDCGLLHKSLLEQKLNYFSTSSKVIFALAQKNKIGRRQQQRVYDILGLYYASQHGSPQYKKILENIKNRIKDDNERESRPGKRFCNIDRAIQEADISKKEEAMEAEFERYCSDIEPSVKYLKAKMEDWIQRNGPSK